MTLDKQALKKYLRFRNARTYLVAATIALGGCASTDVIRHPVYKAISPTSYATKGHLILLQVLTQMKGLTGSTLTGGCSQTF